MADTPIASRPDPDPAEEGKGAARRRAHASRSVMTADTLRDISSRICWRLLPLLEEDDNRGTVGLYAAMSAEVDLDELAGRLVGARRTIAFPRVVGDGLMVFHTVASTTELTLRQPGPSLPAIREPSGLTPVITPDLLIIPGLAFDRDGGRLGYGGGYYDRYLEDHMVKQTIGVCPDALLVGRVPCDEHDQRIDAVVTEHDVYLC